MLDQPTFITQCETDDEGNLILPFPEELLQVMDWGEGTTIDIGVLPGTIVLREVKES